jgi:hypothetical protein
MEKVIDDKIIFNKKYNLNLPTNKSIIGLNFKEAINIIRQHNNVNIYSYPSYLTNTTLDNLVNIIYEDKKVVNIIYDIKNT